MAKLFFSTITLITVASTVVNGIGSAFENAQSAVESNRSERLEQIK